MLLWWRIKIFPQKCHVWKWLDHRGAISSSMDSFIDELMCCWKVGPGWRWITGAWHERMYSCPRLLPSFSTSWLPRTEHFFLLHAPLPSYFHLGASKPYTKTMASCVKISSLACRPSSVNCCCIPATTEVPDIAVTSVSVCYLNKLL